ncbi:MAG TPA: KUP/HAK/KT family potassium transporter [Burkholderiaceae bacterium]|nr:KUP/HAK/KT family potassium transporter [Burkholderiaceae bacterium]
MTAPSSQRLPPLVLAALGVVFGDIGTSPLYAFKEAFAQPHGLPLTPEKIFPVLSMIFWAVTVIVSLKYVTVMLRFDHRGEGGVLALLSNLLTLVRERPRVAWAISVLGIFAASLFYGDAIITPAISVLSAVEGITVVEPALAGVVVPAALVILVGLFVLQRSGTAKVGALFGPVMVLWFAVMAILGAVSIARTPDVLGALDPRHALGFAFEHPDWTFVALSAVFLTMTGAEALFADLGHFGAKPIRIGWFLLVFPCLMLNYLGQGALVLRDPEAVRNPFFLLAPEPLRVPMVVLATLATVIASQATISGAFSVTQQASRLNLLPRLKVLYTSDVTRGQVYIPVVNWLLLAAVLLLVLGFRSSGALAAAYGIAVSGDLLIGSVLLSLTVLLSPAARLKALLPLLVLFLALEVAFFTANASKIAEGGWFPLAVAGVMFTVLTTWRRGIEIMRGRKEALPRVARDELNLDLSDIPRVPGAAVFFSSTRFGYPGSFLHNLKHNKIVHEQTVFMTVEFDDVPRVPDDERVELQRGNSGVMRLVAHFGFREDPDVRKALRLARRKGLELDVDETSFFTSKPVIVSVSRRGPFGWRRSLFGWMMQNSPSAANYFGLPPNRVIELGSQVAI